MCAQAAPTSSAPSGDRRGRYELLLQIGRGGMAKVFLARASGMGGFERRFAIKVMHDDLRDEPTATQELIKEARLAARLRHPNVVPVLDVGQERGDVFLVMDYVEGDVLSGLTRSSRSLGEPLPDSLAMRILADALAGLHAAHELHDDAGASLELVHRDFSPQNILVGVDGVTRLTDFGIAKIAGGAGNQTREGLVKGKVGYMSPEQIRGRALDRRSDIWAAGVVGWELVAGRRLYPPGDEIVTAFQIVSQPPTRLRTVRPETPAAVDECIARALSPDRDHRFATADEFRRALIAALGAPLADPADVARHVQRVVQPTLDARSKAIAELLRARADGAAARPVDESGADLPALIDLTAGSARAAGTTPWGWLVAGSAIAAALVGAAALGPWRAAPDAAATADAPSAAPVVADAPHPTAGELATPPSAAVNTAGPAEATTGTDASSAGSSAPTSRPKVARPAAAPKRAAPRPGVPGKAAASALLPDTLN